MSGHQCRKAREQWKAETDVRLPTWLRLGVKNAGNGILGRRKICKGTKDKPAEYKRHSDTTKDVGRTKDGTEYQRAKLLHL